MDFVRPSFGLVCSHLCGPYGDLACFDEGGERPRVVIAPETCLRVGGLDPLVLFRYNSAIRGPDSSDIGRCLCKAPV